MKIRKIEDEEGFRYPYIDDSLCINCGLCEKVCPMINPVKVPEKSVAAYVVQNTEADVLRSSTSGGFIDPMNN